MGRDLLSASDFELLRLSARSEEAFAVFYRRHERLVAGWLVRKTGRPDVAADLTAEVFSAAYLAAASFRDGPEPAGAWLLGIARNKLLRSLRAERIETSARRRLGVERIEVSDETLAAVDGLRDLGVVELLEGLPADLREAVRGRIVDDTDYVELAARLEVSPATARKRVSRGLSALRRGLQHEGDTA